MAASEDDWSIYGVHGHTCKSYSEQIDHARTDGSGYEVVILQSNHATEVPKTSISFQAKRPQRTPSENVL